MTIPVHPGLILRDRFLKPMKITRKRLADHLGWSIKQVDRICDGESGIQPKKALQLGAAFRMRPEFWMKAQAAFDLWMAAKNVKWPARLIKHEGKLPLIPKVDYVVWHPMRKPRQAEKHKRNKYNFKTWKIGQSKRFPLEQYHRVHNASISHNKRNDDNVKLDVEMNFDYLNVTRIK
jgi:addiction module HigA family antidote